MACPCIRGGSGAGKAFPGVWRCRLHQVRMPGHDRVCGLRDSHRVHSVHGCHAQALLRLLPSRPQNPGRHRQCMSLKAQCPPGISCSLQRASCGQLDPQAFMVKHFLKARMFCEQSPEFIQGLVLQIQRVMHCGADAAKEKDFLLVHARFGFDRTRMHRMHAALHNCLSITHFKMLPPDSATTKGASLLSRASSHLPNPCQQCL